ncbi:MAG: hypothetical protein ACPGSO_04495 [Vicingaceae bacterium]
MAFNTHNTDDIEIRPRFKLLSKSYSSKELLERVEKAIPKDKTIVGKAKGTHVFLSIPENEQHFWSPAMEVVIEQDYEDEEQTQVRCLIGPKQTVWMMVMFFYISVAVVLLFGGMYGLVKWNMGHETNLLWLIPIGLVLELLIFLATKWGQKKGRDQMLHLVSFLYHALNDDSLERK